MEECLISMNKDEDDEGCLKFYNILKWSATVQENYRTFLLCDGRVLISNVRSVWVMVIY